MSDWNTPTIPEGTRVRLIYMPDDPDPIPAGTLGTVSGGNREQVFVDWDNGRGLSLVIGVDQYEVVRERP